MVEKLDGGEGGQPLAEPCNAALAPRWRSWHIDTTWTLAVGGFVLWGGAKGANQKKAGIVHSFHFHSSHRSMEKSLLVLLNDGRLCAAPRRSHPPARGPRARAQRRSRARASALAPRTRSAHAARCPAARAAHPRVHAHEPQMRLLCATLPSGSRADRRSASAVGTAVACWQMAAAAARSWARCTRRATRGVVLRPTATSSLQSVLGANVFLDS